jgi:hypothetical protein
MASEQEIIDKLDFEIIQDKTQTSHNCLFKLLIIGDTGTHLTLSRGQDLSLVQNYRKRIPRRTRSHDRR